MNHNKGKEKREVIWCTLCRTKGHHKNGCPTFAQYLAAGVPNPFLIGGLWCEICKTQGHDPYHCPMMHKYKIVPQSSHYNFCKLVSQNDKDCRTLEFIREITSNTYSVKAEMMTGQATPQFNNVQPQFNIVQPQYKNPHPQYNNA